ncbi:MAG: DUF2283 domain-containing protein [Methanobrevibacter sp.]|jgi:uncharacterized protein YuzE|nr:DUF2283 domain-containing protein [Candidatus Methanoflexus mossambicus]
MNEKITVDYDDENDNLFVFLQNEDYDYSEIITKNVFIDFNKDEKPVGFEIDNASKLFKTNKSNLKNIIGGNVKIVIDEKDINLNVNLYVEIQKQSVYLNPINIIENNNFNIPSIETTHVLT